MERVPRISRKETKNMVQTWKNIQHKSYVLVYKKLKTLKVYGTYFHSFAKIYLTEYLSTLVAGCEDALSINKTALLGKFSDSRRLHTQKSLQSIPENLLFHPFFFSLLK